MTTVVHFCWSYQAEEVSLAGSFNDWKPIELTRTLSKIFRLSLELPYGTYQYKYIVKDVLGYVHWCYDGSQPIVNDGHNNWNNVVTVKKKPQKNTFYITTAINYTNGSPHFGHAYEALTADTIAKYHRVAGKKPVYFMTGTDEHGQKVADAAALNGLKPIELCDKYVAEFKSLNQKLSVTEDFYIRTTMPKHIDTTHWLWNRALKNGDIYLGKYEGWYNVREEKFVTETEAAKDKYLDTGSGKPLIKTSEPSYFFRMSKYQQPLIQHIYDNPGFIWPEEREAEVLTRLKDPLLDLSISRTTFNWGVPVPNDESHVMYVWFDALTNYLSALDYPHGELAKFWPADVHLIGKDICWFHTVIWPCMLLSAGVPLPKQVVSHGFVNGPDGRKMSKTYGNVVNPSAVLESFSPDLVRYFCLREGVFGEDFSYSQDSLITRNDSELADDVGNLIQRAFNLASLWTEGKVPDAPFEELFSLDELKNKVEEFMLQFKIQQAYETVLNSAKITNKYLADIAPWNLKEPKHLPIKLKCLRTVLEAVYILGHFYLPIMPKAMNILFEYFALPPKKLSEIKGWGNLIAGHPFNFNNKPLFPKIRDNRFVRKQKQQQQQQQTQEKE